jgi:tRNA(Ile)-lysidine synthetase-like protein
LNEVISILSSDEPNSEIHLPDNLMVIREYDSFTIRTNTDPIEFDIEINDFGTYVLPTGDRIIVAEKKAEIPTDSYKLCYNDLVFPIRVRNRLDGDKMTLPFGTKKVKSLFIDQKIPKTLRETLPLILHNEEIIWIPGVKGKKIEGKNYIYIGYQKGDYYE